MTAPNKKFIAIAGNVGVGKSTLTGMIADRLDWEPFVELPFANILSIPAAASPPPTPRSP